MTKRNSFAAMAALGFSTAILFSPAHSQTAKDLVGAWQHVANVNTAADGKKSDAYGANPKGIAIFSADGHFAIIVLRNDLPKIAANNRSQATAEESLAIVRGSNALYGTYSVADKVIDMKIEPFLISSSVMAILAQRLVRTLCTECREAYTMTSVEMTELELSQSAGQPTIYRAKGCPACFQTGYYGRTAIYELLELDDEVRQLIMKNADASTLKALAVKKGMRTLRQDRETSSLPLHCVHCIPISRSYCNRVCRVKMASSL